METISRERLTELAAEHLGPRLSIYAETDRRAVSPAANQLRFRNLLREAEERLADAGVDAQRTGALVAPCRDLLAAAELWEHPQDGLAVFASAEGAKVFQLPATPRQKVVVGERFHIRPLLRLLDGTRTFHLLAVSQAKVRLFLCDGTAAHEVRIAAMPSRLEDAVGGEVEPQYLQAHAGVRALGGKRSLVVHGAGSASEDVKAELPRFLQRIDAALRAEPSVWKSPLVLAGVEYLVAIYRRISHHPHLVESAVFGNPDERSGEELRASGWEVARPALSAAERATAVRHLEGADREKVCADLPSALAAAREGRIEALFLADGAEAWGQADGGRVQVHASPAAGDQDLLDLAASLTLQNGGRVYVTEGGRVPSGGDLAALLRY